MDSPVENTAQFFETKFVTTEINRIAVQFPFQPYPQQNALMTTIINALQKSENALVESPTGTGKTLCLLCSTLAWRSTYMLWRKEAMRSETERDTLVLDQLSMQAFGSMHSDDRPIGKPPQIFFASRTHSQLSQAISELRNTAYRNAVCTVVGSRDQMCINPAVAQVKNTLRASLCKSMVQKQTCSYHAESEGLHNHAAATALIMDIEDLVVFGRERKACPYYMSKAIQPRADIIFLPYNYLVDRNSRNSQNFSLENSIIIFDEGHNMESCCNDATSFEISTHDLELSIQELDTCIKILSTHRLKQQEFFFEIDMDEILILQALLLNLKINIQKLLSTPRVSSKELEGSYILKLFGPVELDGVVQNFNSKVVDTCLGILTYDQIFVKKRQHPSLLTFKSALRIAVQAANEDHSALSHYMIYIQYTSTKSDSKSATHYGFIPDKNNQDILLSFWCFNSGVAMQELKRMKVRSIVVASGTLSPLDGFSDEMGIPFPHRLENTHVIDQSQVYISVVTKGSQNIPISTAYKSRETNNSTKEFGNAIIEFAKIVPDGMLVFFTSYSIMNTCISVWKQPSNDLISKSIWESISELKYPIMESRNQQEFVLAMKSFEERIDQKKWPPPIFFAICRGRVSEGIDFSDRKGRAVVIYGIPYPTYKDPNVMLKQKYLDSAAAKSQGRIRGKEWYLQQACRSVNQAIGRVIRHKNDFGAILLCDERFQETKTIRNLPHWLRSSINIPKTFEGTRNQLIEFFKGATNRELMGNNRNNTSLSHQILCNSSLVADPLSRPVAITHKILPITSINCGKAAPFIHTTQQKIPYYALKLEHDPLRDASRFGSASSQKYVKRTYQHIHDPLSNPSRLQPVQSKPSLDCAVEQRLETTKYSSNHTLHCNAIVPSDSTNNLTPFPIVSRPVYSAQHILQAENISTPVTLDKPLLPPKNVLSVNDPRQFMEKVARIAPTSINKKFKRLLYDYSKRTIKIQSLISASLDTFIDELNQYVSLEECLELAKEFRLFIGSRHHSLYDTALCLKISQKTPT
ncbi:hypothetical protein RTP6_003303 [Batrachochytrium dendrobatidis]